MRATNFDRVFASAPLNKTAGSVVSKSRHHYEPQVKPPAGKEHWAEPPPVLPPETWPTGDGFEDLRGRRMGRMVIVGYLGRINNCAKARWLAKCSCGDYEARGKKAVTSNTDNDHCCHNCAHLEKLKRRKMPSVDDWLAEQAERKRTTAA